MEVRIEGAKRAEEAAEAAAAISPHSSLADGFIMICKAKHHCANVA